MDFFASLVASAFAGGGNTLLNTLSNSTLAGNQVKGFVATATALANRLNKLKGEA